MKQQLDNLKANLSAAMVGRNAEIHSMLRALIAHEHFFMLGKPGVGKSYISNLLMHSLQCAGFRLLLTRFSTPEELLGPLRLTRLQADEYERNLAGRLAEAEIAFIDEVFKGSSAILNTLLTAMEERIVDNGGKVVKIPLRSMIGASNELPEPGELDAIYDRFLVRRIVKAVGRDERRTLLFGTFQQAQAAMTIGDLDMAHAQAMTLPVDDDAQNCLMEIWEKLETAGIEIGDRRARKAVKIAQAEAYLDGAAKVQREHLQSLEDIFWSTPDQIKPMREIIFRATNPEMIQLNEYIEEIDKISEGGSDLRTIVTNANKLDTIIEKIGRMKPTEKAHKVRESAQYQRDLITAKQAGCSIDQVRALRKMGAA